MKKIVSFILAAILTISFCGFATATPAHGMLEQWEQPSGEKFWMRRLGDELGITCYSEQGYYIAYNEEDKYMYYGEITTVRVYYCPLDQDISGIHKYQDYPADTFTLTQAEKDFPKDKWKLSMQPIITPTDAKYMIDPLPDTVAYFDIKPNGKFEHSRKTTWWEKTVMGKYMEKAKTGEEIDPRETTTMGPYTLRQPTGEEFTCYLKSNFCFYYLYATIPGSDKAYILIQDEATGEYRYAQRRNEYEFYYWKKGARVPTNYFTVLPEDDLEAKYPEEEYIGDYVLEASDKVFLIDSMPDNVLVLDQEKTRSKAQATTEWERIEMEEQILAAKKLEAGDVNGDGEIDIKDALLTLRYSVQLEKKLYPNQLKAADVTGDTEINVVDALRILQKSVGIIDSF